MDRVDYLAEKCVNLRIFEDSHGKFNLSLMDIEGEALVVPQFTLYGNCRKGRRPSFDEAAEPELARKVYNSFIEALKRKRVNVSTGMFGAKMLVEIYNDGPVTFILESS